MLHCSVSKDLELKKVSCGALLIAESQHQYTELKINVKKYDSAYLIQCRISFTGLKNLIGQFSSQKQPVVMKWLH